MDALRSAGAQAVHLCGSGSAVFGVLPTGSEAKAVLARLDGSSGEGFVCHSIGADEVVAP